MTAPHAPAPMRRFLTIALVLVAARTAGAQFPPQKLQNLKVFPKDIPVRTLIDTMASFTRALGVRCTYCHVGEESQPLSSYDFPSDQKPEKEKAREMLRMVGAINGEYLTKLTARRTPPITVACATCHRGVTEPRPLQQIVLNTELTPTSAFAFRQAADAQLAAGDTAAAVRSFQRALAINPNDRQAKGALDKLGAKP